MWLKDEVSSPCILLAVNHFPVSCQENVTQLRCAKEKRGAFHSVRLLDGPTSHLLHVFVCWFLLSLLLHNLAERPFYSCYGHTLNPSFITSLLIHNSNTPETLKACMWMHVRAFSFSFLVPTNAHIPDDIRKISSWGLDWFSGLCDWLGKWGKVSGYFRGRKKETK